MRPPPRLALSLLAAAPALACGEAPPEAPREDAAALDLGAGEEDAGAPLDAGRADLGPADAGTSRPDVCARLGLPTRPLQAGASTYRFGDVAGDFAARTLDGERWRLSERWTGCASYIFVTYAEARGSPSQTDRLWQSPPTPLIRSPLNAHYFFLSWEQAPAARSARVEAMRASVEAALDAEALPPEARARQRARFHFVIDAPTEVEGSVGAFFTDYARYYQDPASRVDLGDRGMAPPPFPLAVGIDRFQAWDAVGSLSDVVGGSFDLRMVSYLPDFYDHKAALEDRLATETGVEERVLVDEVVTERIFTRTATLPGLSAYDTLEVDVRVRCRARNVFACSEWDRIARVEVCLDPTCDARRELVRWITPYWRRGERRWVIDASALLGLLGDGGARRFRVVMGPRWERKTPRDVRVALRLSNRGKDARAAGAVRAFTGGSFDIAYNASQPPFAFTPPASARRVEVVYLLSGHGQARGSNCAEWCDHRHQFAVDGTLLPEIAHDGAVGSRGGCGERARDGVPPGQWGNWAPERAYWCPGLPVAHGRLDITELVTPGRTSTLTYSASLGGGAPGGGNISLSAYVTWFE
jgi:hypothetical protein